MEKVGGSEETGGVLPVTKKRKSEEDENQTAAAIEEEAEEDELEYFRYYTSHKGELGNETLKLEIRRGRKLIYTNTSKDSKIRREVTLSKAGIKEVARIINESQIMEQNDKDWPEDNFDGIEELEIAIGGYRVEFKTKWIVSLYEAETSCDPNGLRIFFNLAKELKRFLIDIALSHTRINPFG